jgi:acyl-coenzyme A thioesterase PaaI-like protein
VSFLTFMASPRPQDLTPFPMDGMRTTGAMTVPLAEHVGARVRSPGAVEVTHRPFVQQAAGALQGGVVALVGEMAAETLADRPVIELDVRYLSSVRIGPARAVAAPMGSEHVRVEVRDLGNADRLAARIVARLAPPSPHPPS